MKAVKVIDLYRFRFDLLLSLPLGPPPALAHLLRSLDLRHLTLLLQLLHVRVVAVVAPLLRPQQDAAGHPDAAPAATTAAVLLGLIRHVPVERENVRGRCCCCCCCCCCC